MPLMYETTLMGSFPIVLKQSWNGGKVEELQGTMQFR